MTPEDLQRQQIQRAGEARQILDSRMFQEARADIEGTLASLRRSVHISQTDMHTRIILMEQLWARLLDYFEQIGQTGKMAQLNLEEIKKQRESWLQRLREFTTTGRGAL